MQGVFQQYPCDFALGAEPLQTRGRAGAGGGRRAERGPGGRPARNEHLQPRAAAGCGARGTSLTCEASAALHRHAAPHRAERGPVACSASLCGPDHAAPATTHQLHRSDRLPHHTTPSRIVIKLRHRRGGASQYNRSCFNWLKFYSNSVSIPKIPSSGGDSLKSHL